MKGSSTKSLARILRSSLIFSLILALFATSTARAEAEILYFLAEYQNNVVVLEWETGFETDLNGFFVTRSNAQNGSYSRISTLIPSEGGEGFGSTYEFTDEYILNDTTYWYRLEVVDNDNRVTFSESVQVVPGSANTPTATGSTTAQLTAPAGTTTATTFFSATQTALARTSTPTAPLLPGTGTVTVPAIGTGTALLTPIVTATLEATVTLSATATLIPLPEITLQFPTPVSNLDISSEGSEMKQEDPSEEQRSNILRAIERALFIGFIALVWIVLAVWFYISSRRVE